LCKIGMLSASPDNQCRPLTMVLEQTCPLLQITFSFEKQLVLSLGPDRHWSFDHVICAIHHETGCYWIHQAMKLSVHNSTLSANVTQSIKLKQFLRHEWLAHGMQFCCIAIFSSDHTHGSMALSLWPVGRGRNNRSDLQTVWTIRRQQTEKDSCSVTAPIRRVSEKQLKKKTLYVFGTSTVHVCF
jgi:hypothetical protein